eukprot:2032823-Prymnesium_polylepis.1
MDGRPAHLLLLSHGHAAAPCSTLWQAAISASSLYSRSTAAATSSPPSAPMTTTRSCCGTGSAASPSA